MDALKLLTRDVILAAQDLKVEQVAVPEWGGVVYVKTMTGAERDDFEASLYAGRGEDRQQNLENLRGRLVARVTVNADGTRLFQDDDALELGRKSVRALDRIFEVAQRLNGLRAKDVEDLTKN